MEACQNSSKFVEAFQGLGAHENYIHGLLGGSSGSLSSPKVKATLKLSALALSAAAKLSSMIIIVSVQQW